jgi:hypothetical protein
MLFFHGDVFCLEEYEVGQVYNKSCLMSWDQGKGLGEKG